MSDLIDSDLTQMLRAANRCVKQSANDLQEIVIILKQESTFMTKTDLQQNTENALQGLKEEQTKCFMQLWMLIAVRGFYKGPDEAKRKQLAELAALTPVIDYNQDFQLCIRNNPQKQKFNEFAEAVSTLFL